MNKLKHIDWRDYDKNGHLDNDFIHKFNLLTDAVNNLQPREEEHFCGGTCAACFGIEGEESNKGFTIKKHTNEEITKEFREESFPPKGELRIVRGPVKQETLEKQIWDIEEDWWSWCSENHATDKYNIKNIQRWWINKIKSLKK